MWALSLGVREGEARSGGTVPASWRQWRRPRRGPLRSVLAPNSLESDPLRGSGYRSGGRWSQLEVGPGPQPD